MFPSSLSSLVFRRTLFLGGRPPHALDRIFFCPFSLTTQGPSGSANTRKLPAAREGLSLTVAPVALPSGSCHIPNGLGSFFLRYVFIFPEPTRLRKITPILLQTPSFSLKDGISPKSGPRARPPLFFWPSGTWSYAPPRNSVLMPRFILPLFPLEGFLSCW